MIHSNSCSATKVIETVFQNRPWSFNGMHLILKEWKENQSIRQVTFETNTFTVQIHGFPPNYMREVSTRMINNKLGKVHDFSFKRKFIIASRFLKFRVDIVVNDPLSTGFFFFEQKENDEIWIQFKYEKLADLCYTCRLLNHVIGRCNLSSSAMIISSKGIRVELYSLWIRVQYPGNLLFINPSEDDE